MDIVRNACLTLGRIALAGWVLAAALFVVTTLQEVTSTGLEAPTKAHLTDLRFPAYYSFGFSLLITGFVSSVIGCQSTGIGRFRKVTVIALAGTALLLMAVDYFWIYGPLREMSADPLAARPAEFVIYHRYSMQINGVELLVAALAAAFVSWPVGKCGDAQVDAMVTQ